MGEATTHPEFVNFLETVFNTGVVPNYTTNGLVFSQESGETAQRLLVATQRFCGGVAVSFGNRELRGKARKAVALLAGLDDVKVNIHHIIFNKETVDDFLAEQDRYGDRIYYHVLLPLVHGDGGTRLEAGTWEYLEEKLSKDRLVNVSFGARFENYLKGSKAIKAWMYPSESLSKNVLLQKDRVVITPSSFDLTPIKIIDL